MKNKKGVFFGIYLVVLTILMIGIVIMLYFKEQKNVNSTLVSPVPVLELRDNLEHFEMRENEIALDVFSSFGKDPIEFKKSFLDSVGSDDFMKYFLLNDLIINDKGVDANDLDYKNFLENKVYVGNFELKNEAIIIKRSILTKRMNLSSMNGDIKIRFPVNLSFDFSREFKVDAGGVK